MADLQELVDDLAEEIGRPISVEDRRWRLVAHSAHTGATDAVRRTTILAREAPPEVAAWLESLGVLAATTLFDVPANPALGMAERACMPVRHQGVLLGFVWVVVGDRPLDTDAQTALQRIADAAQELLWERRTHSEALQHHVRTLLADPDAGAVLHACIELAAALRVRQDAPIAVGVATGDGDVGERVRRTWPHGGLVWAPHDGRIVVIAALPARGEARALAQALAAAGADLAAASAGLGLGGTTGETYREAALAMLVLQAAPHVGRAVAWTELGGWRLVTDLWDRAGRPAPPPEVQALATHRQRDELVAAVEATLDAGGDVAAAADTLGVHRATLYRRLRRAHEVCGLDPFDGDDRLVLQVGLRIRRLVAVRHTH